MAEDPKGRRLEVASSLEVLEEFWPEVAEDRGELSLSVGLEKADEVLGRTIALDQEFADASPGGLRNRIREKVFYRELVPLDQASSPSLQQEVRGAIARLPPGVLGIIGWGADIGIATFPPHLIVKSPTVSRNIDEYNRRWRILLGSEVVDAPGEVVRGIFLHELCHVILGKSPEIRPLWRARKSFDEDRALRANEAIEEKVVRLACELGFTRETKVYLERMQSLYPDAPGNSRFLRLVNGYE